MNILKWILGLLLLLPISVYGLSRAPNYDVRIEKLSQGVFIANQGDSWTLPGAPGAILNTNSLIMKMKNSTLVIVDTLYTPQAMEYVLNWIKSNEELKDFKELIALNTHFHIDRLGGNEAIASRGYKIFGSDLTVTLLKERGEMRKLPLDRIQNMDPASQSSLKEFKLIPPNHLFHLQKDKSGVLEELKIGDEKIIVSYPGHGHADDNIVVYFPSQKVLFGGCVIYDQSRSEIGDHVVDGNRGTWKDALINLKQFNFRFLIPGHGHDFSPTSLDHTIQLLNAF